VNDDEFLQAFEACALQPATFGHGSHLRAAFLLLRRDGPERGPQSVAAGLRRFVEAHGLHHVYNETLTLFWARVVASAMAAVPAARSLEALLAAAPHLRDSALPLRHYRRETLYGDAARAAFVPPDLYPLP
jgi:phosphinothricin acetyltransferase